jgi:glycosyltransferase involved in cell wall biosynthesis
MTLISVIIPAYNCEKTIKETIEAVLNQTFTDLELILINDGSQDNTLDVVSQISDPRIQVFSYPNAGVSASRNRGIFHATGEYISFIDADDLWTADKLETQLKALQENPKAAVAYSWTDWIDESGKFLGTGVHLTITGDVFSKLLLVDFMGSGSNALIRKQALIEVGGFETSLVHAEDWDLWLRLAARYHFVAIPSPQILYRKSTNSASMSVLKMEAGSLKVIERAYAQAPDSLKHLKLDTLGNRYKYLTWKALEKPTMRQQGFTAMRFLLQAIKNDPVLLRTKVIWKVLLKSMTVALLAPQQAQALLNRMNKISNIDAILAHSRLEPSQLADRQQ